MIAPWAERYVGTSYEHKGRTSAGLDCLGLLYLIYKQEYGLTPPDYEYTHSDYSTIEQVYVRNRNKWLQKTLPSIGDLVMFNIAGMATHLGIYIGAGKFIHAIEGSDVTVEELNSVRWRNRIEGFYQWKK